MKLNLWDTPAWYIGNINQLQVTIIISYQVIKREEKYFGDIPNTTT